MADPSAPQTLLDRLAALELDVRALRSPQPPTPWATYTPVWTQGATITHTVVRNEYNKIGRSVRGVLNLSALSAGTASTAIEVSTPVAAMWGSSTVVGAGWHYNGAGAINLPVVVYLFSTGIFRFQPAFTATLGSYGAAAVFYTSAAGANTSYTPTVASGHGLTFHYQFEAAA